jgi:hypothetical protein
MRGAVSNDGRIAKFFLTFKGGQHSAFAIPFHKAYFAESLNRPALKWRPAAWGKMASLDK